MEILYVTHMGQDSQSFLEQLYMIFVTFSLKILRFFKLNIVFDTDIGCC
jgi:hypothetical protein